MTTIHAVTWTDKMLGNLHLYKATPEEAVASAQSIRERGGDKLERVRAVTLHPDNRLDVLDGPAFPESSS